MKLETHIRITNELYGIDAEDIHIWIDAFFNYRRFVYSARMRFADGYDPYAHRKYRHCLEALEEAFAEFEGKYSREQIQNVFIQHLKDDYGGYVPQRKDFMDDDFLRRYHHK